jgi:predicted DsbA family dithiol-disulfide isomerase
VTQFSGMRASPRPLTCVVTETTSQPETTTTDAVHSVAQAVGTISVDIWSDIACPWCYIGKRKFEAGMQKYLAAGDDRAVAIEYHSFELAPDTPVDFEGDELDFLSRHKGMPREQVQEMLARVTDIAASVGLDYDFGKLHHTNTVKAHELLHIAKDHGVQLELMERLFKAYFVEGGHVGRIEDLVAYGAEVGLDPVATETTLRSGEMTPRVREDQAIAGQYGIQGVPFFVLDGAYGISGAQEADTFADVLEQVLQVRMAAAAELAAENAEGAATGDKAGA